MHPQRAECVRRISIHAPPRGATVLLLEVMECMIYFNSRPSARGDAMASRASRSSGLISIHAPPRGATFRLQRDYHGALISIHAPPRGATFGLLLLLFDKAFQFTPLREGRRRGDIERRQNGNQFQFTPLREGRPGSVAVIPYRLLFQFTPLREGRRGRSAAVPAYRKNFNSRPSARGDSLPRRRPARRQISIHAPPRGATRPESPRQVSG